MRSPASLVGRCPRWPTAVRVGLVLAATSLACAPTQRSESGARLPSPDRFRQARIAADVDGGVYVVAIESGFAAGDRVFLTASADHGQSWQSSEALHEAIPRSRRAVEIATGGRRSVYVVWLEEPRRVAFNRSLDGCRTWLPREIGLDGASGSALHPFDPQIASDDRGNVYVVWLDDREGFEAFYGNRSRDAGATWLPNAIRITPLSLGRKSVPQLRCDDQGYVYVLWHEERDGQVGVFFNASNDFGETWELQDLRLDEGRNARGTSLVIFEDRRLLAAWSEWGGAQVALHARTSFNGGRSWDPVRRLSIADRGSGNPSVPLTYAAANRHAGVAWQRTASDGSEQILLMHSADGGTRFEQSFVERARSESYFLQPSRRSADLLPFGADADANGNVYVVWAEAIFGPGSIMCERLIGAGGAGLRRGVRATVAGIDLVLVEPPHVEADDFGNVVILWNEGSRLVVASSPFFGDTGWRSTAF